MRLAFYTVCISPHQLPLSRALIDRIGEDNFRYICHEPLEQDRVRLGWSDESSLPWVLPAGERLEERQEWLENADVLFAYIRDVGLLERRQKAGRVSFYCGERWLKPPVGLLRLASPGYFKMVCRFARLVWSGGVVCLPIGVHAARDFARIMGLLHGDVRCLFRAPEVKYERSPMGCVEGCPWMRIWGYFVEPSALSSPSPRASTSTHVMRVLWVGRMLNWKRVDTIIRAVAQANKELVKNHRSPSPFTFTSITLTLVGSGPEESRLKKLANSIVQPPTSNLQPVVFLPPVPIGEVRSIMRQHDVYVLSSNAFEGWGAVVSEALEEGMKVLGTYESGATATLLSDSCLFHVGDWRRLAALLQSYIPKVGIGKWTADYAAVAFLKYVDEIGIK